MLVIVLYAWLCGRDGVISEDEADATYFLGFLLTLSYLSLGLHNLGSSASVGEAQVSGFLKDLGWGLGFSIVGLGVRQLLILRRPEVERAVGSEISAAGTGSAPSDSPVSDKPAENDDPLDIYRTDIKRMSKHVSDAMEVLASKASETASIMGTAGGTFVETMRASTERFRSEINAFIPEFQLQRSKLTKELEVATAESMKSQTEIGTTFRSQLQAWEGEMLLIRQTFERTRSVGEKEVAESMRHLQNAAGALSILANSIRSQIEAMPEPSARIRALWTALTDVEEKLTGAASRTITSLNQFESAASSSATAATVMGRQSAIAGGAIEQAGVKLKEDLLKDLQRSQQVIDEFYGMVEDIMKRGRNR